MLNVIALWNAIYIQAVVENLQAQGGGTRPIPPTSPASRRWFVDSP